MAIGFGKAVRSTKPNKIKRKQRYLYFFFMQLIRVEAPRLKCLTAAIRWADTTYLHNFHLCRKLSIYKRVLTRIYAGMFHCSNMADHHMD